MKKAGKSVGAFQKRGAGLRATYIFEGVLKIVPGAREPSAAQMAFL
ncbi:MAG: hypothetical protein KH054_07630 [Firmicutes bacterium]|nr:hypothetical protein [Bacillota bacterium]